MMKNYKEIEPAEPVRVQIPQDAVSKKQYWKPGTMPEGGFRASFCFDEKKVNGTTKPGRKVY
jgi:hypothetical protein